MGIKTMHDAIEMKNGDICYKTALGNMGAGDYVKRKPDAKAVYVINFRERAKRGKPAYYSLSKYDDMNSEIFLSAETPVFVGFTF